jgi:hypothetical protein
MIYNRAIAANNINIVKREKVQEKRVTLSNIEC